MRPPLKGEGTLHRQDVDIDKDSALLYELSLAIGTSLDLSENSTAFLEALVAQDDLEYAAVWVARKYLPDERGAEGYIQVAAVPAAWPTPSFLEPEHPLLERLGTQGRYSLVADDPVFTDLAPRGTGSAGVVAVLALGDHGVLMLYAGQRRQPFDASWFDLRADLFRKFTVSVQGCLSYREICLEAQDGARAVAMNRTAVRRLSALIEHLQVGVLVEDEARRLIVVNQHFCDLFGIPAPPELLVGSDCAVAQQQSKHLFEDPEAFVASVDACLAAQRTVVGEALRLADGRLFVRDYVPVVVDGTYQGHLWQYRDVTSQREADTALRKSEAEAQRLALVASRTSDGVIITDAQGLTEWVNEGFTRITGYTLDEMRGQPPGALLKGAETDPETIAFIQQQEEKQSAFQTRLVNYKRNGEKILVQVDAQPLFDEAGTLTGYMSITTDVTDQVQDRQALEEYARTLERVKEELEAQAIQRQHTIHAIDRARREAEAAGRAKSAFLANMSHEIRTPMNAILGMAYLLSQTQPTEEQQQYLQAITRSGDNLLTLINNILDIAKIESGKITFEKIPFRLSDMLHHVIDMTQFDAWEKGLTLAMHLASDLPEVVVGDSIRLNQVLLNLISNAIKFTEAGSVVVTVRRGIRVGSQVEIQFEVADTGIGIPESQQGRVFENFAQARSDTTRKYGGTGLGLAIVKELVERQGGRITLESAVGEGSIFTVFLPFSISTALPLASEDRVQVDISDVDLKGTRILLVEDNDLNRFVARHMLEQWGAQVEGVENGRVAIEKLCQRSFDLVLMDIQMPEMDGYQTTRYIRETLGISSEQLPILALTASALIDQREVLEAAGMNGFILKPFDPDDLRLRLARHLGLYAEPAYTEASPLSSARPFINLAFLEANALGQEDFIPKMIDLFFSEVPNLLQLLQHALDDEDWPQIAFLAHKMKASTGMLGITVLHDALGVVEHLADEQVDTDQLPERIREVGQLAKQAMEALKQIQERYKLA